MSLVIGLGSNLGNREEHLKKAIQELQKYFSLKKQSRLYLSEAVDYFDQPPFVNQVVEFEKPPLSPQEVLRILLTTETKLGRTREIPSGPRTIDIDLLFWGTEKIQEPHLVVPHPRWQERSFVIRPLSELPFFEALKKWTQVPDKFAMDAHPLDKK
jgi:2-amino-4-hydroxy-6-hydroxymethyldihydropteridine diphosphokinase